MRRTAWDPNKQEGDAVGRFDTWRLWRDQSYFRSVIQELENERLRSGSERREAAPSTGPEDGKETPSAQESNVTPETG